MKHVVLYIAFCLTSQCFAQSVQIGNTAVSIDTLTTSLNIPWEIQIDPDQNYLWLTERVGNIKRVDLNTGNTETALDLTSEVEAYGEAGLLGMALHPDFPAQPWVYVTYCYGPRDSNDDFFERVSRFEWNGSTLQNEDVLLEGIKAHGNHNGSRLLFLQDGTLLVSTGDYAVTGSAQDMNSLNGKFLRMTAEGQIPADNPDPQSYIYTSGHRNPQGVVQLSSGLIVATEHGPDTDDEINFLTAGANYGWPLVHGYCDQPFENTPCSSMLYTEPHYHWTPTIAPNDLIFYQNPAFPEWHNRLLMTSLKDETLYAVELDATEQNVSDVETWLSNDFGRLRDIAVDSLGRIYLATNSGAAGSQSIIRISPPSTLSLGSIAGVSAQVYPNPAHAEITVLGNFSSMSIVDNSGRTLNELPTLGASTTILDVSNLTPGNYFLKVSDGKADETVVFQKL